MKRLKAFKYKLIEALHEAFEEEIDFYGGQKARLVWKETILNIPAINTNQHDSFVMDMMGNALGEVLEGNKTPEEALNETERLIERRIRR